MGASKRAGDMPATVIDLLERDWRADRGSPAVIAAFLRWREEDPALGQFGSIDALVSFVEDRRRPAPEREEILAALACRAGADEAAAKLLLQLLLPGCKALVAAFGWLGDSPGELAADVIGDVWGRIRAWPASPRPKWVALPVLGAARDQLRRRARRAGREAPCDVLEYTAVSEMLAAEPEPTAAEELAEMLAEAQRGGVLTSAQVELIWAYRVRRVSPAEAAERSGSSPAAIERRRLRAEQRLRSAYAAA